MNVKDSYDVVIVGAGMGGSAVAYALRETDLSTLILERGEYIRQEQENWDPDEVIANRRYDPEEEWLDRDDCPFRPRVYYNVGGSSKFFGGTSFRFRREDFTGKRYPEGTTEPWPISYDDLAPYYDEAERLMWVHGLAGADPTEPSRGNYPYEPLDHEPPIADLEVRLLRLGLRPFPLPIAVHQGPGGRCRKGSPCDGFPCKIRAKGDGENAFLRPAVRAKRDIQVVTGARVQRLGTTEDGTRVDTVVFEVAGERREVGAGTVVLAAGAANTAALLLRSASPRHPDGLANGSGQVGRNFMAHNNTVLMAFNPFRRNPTKFQKTLAINDFYLAAPESAVDAAPGRPVPRSGDAALPLGNIQMRGKVLPQNLARSAQPLVRLFRRFIAARSFDFWIMSEDLPTPENRVEVTPDGTIHLRRELNNLEVHRVLVRTVKGYLRRAGLPFMLEREPAPGTIQHQIGTARFGSDPERSVVDPTCRSHEVANLYIADGSVLPSAAAVNPALTIAANALRVGESLRRRVVRGNAQRDDTGAEKPGAARRRPSGTGSSAAPEG